MDREMCNWVLECPSDVPEYKVSPTLRNLLSLFLPIASAALGQDYFPKPDTAGGWRTFIDAVAIRKTAGIDLKKLDRDYEYHPAAANG